jgi:hypothetical protein
VLVLGKLNALLCLLVSQRRTNFWILSLKKIRTMEPTPSKLLYSVAELSFFLRLKWKLK